MSVCAGDPLVKGYTSSITYRDEVRLWVLDVGGPNCGICGAHCLAAGDGCHDDSLSSRYDVQSGNAISNLRFNPRLGLEVVIRDTCVWNDVW